MGNGTAWGRASRWLRRPWERNRGQVVRIDRRSLAAGADLPAAPKGLGRRRRRSPRRIVGEYDLTTPDLWLLEHACRTPDRIEAARDVLDGRESEAAHRCYLDEGGRVRFRPPTSPRILPATTCEHSSWHVWM